MHRDFPPSAPNRVHIIPMRHLSRCPLNRNALKQMGTGSSRGPHLRWGLGAQMFNLGGVRPSLNIFSGSPPKVFSVGLSPVPVCFGVIRELMQHPLGGCGVSGDEDRVHVSLGMLFPLLPFGLSSPTREECSPPKMRDMLFVLFDKVWISHRDNQAANSTHRTSLAGRGRRLDAHYVRVYLIIRLACEVAKRAAAFKRRLRRL